MPVTIGGRELEVQIIEAMKTEPAANHADTLAPTWRSRTGNRAGGWMPISWGVGDGDSKTKLGVDHVDTLVSSTVQPSFPRGIKVDTQLPYKSTDRMRGTVPRRSKVCLR